MALPCKCSKDSVKIDLDSFCENLKENKPKIIYVDKSMNSIKKPRKKIEKQNKDESISLECRKCRKTRRIKISNTTLSKIEDQFECNKLPELGFVCKYIKRMRKKSKESSFF